MPADRASGAILRNCMPVVPVRESPNEGNNCARSGAAGRSKVKRPTANKAAFADTRLFMKAAKLHKTERERSKLSVLCGLLVKT
jgi:hypothetical protein